MEKKSRASSRQGRQAAKKGPSTTVRITLDQAKARLRGKAKALVPGRPDPAIDFSDIPELTDAQLKRMKRVGPGRPPLGDVPRQMISIKLDRHLLRELKAEAERTGKPYQSLIHEILQGHVRRNAA